jgi:hypothetical protein
MARAMFGTAINCIDGRVQIPVITWMRETLSLDYVDLITQPGADGVLARDASLAEQMIRPRAELSVKRHASPLVAVVGHYDCLANSVDEAEHRANLLAAIATLQTWQLEVKLMALWVNQAWQVEVVKTRGG